MKGFLIVFIAILSTAFVSCSKDESDSNSVAGKTQLNVSYGSNTAQAMDIYLPANRSTTTTKVIVLIHGGGWTDGDKTDPLFAPFVDSIKRRLPDYAVFNINYRLSASPLNIFPTQEMDVKSAIEFIYNKRIDYGISDKFVLVGASAGAHLAMLNAYKYNSPVKAKAVVSLFGPGDLLEMYNNPANNNPIFPLALAQAIGKTPSQDPLIYSNSSPVNFISSTTAMPTILLHGGLDPLVRPAQSAAVKTKLVSAGIASEYILYPTGGHGDWDNATYTDAFTKIQAFLLVHVP